MTGNAPSPQDAAILRDLTRHLHDRMTKVIDDYFDRLEWSGRKFRRDDVADAVGRAILGAAATMMRAKTQSTLDEFTTAARAAYQKD